MSNPAFKFDHVHIISEDPKASANWYVEMLGATIAANTMARGARQIFVDLGGMTILIRGQRPGEDPAAARPIRQYADYSSHNAWGTDQFGFLYQGDLEEFCAELLDGAGRFTAFGAPDAVYRSYGKMALSGAGTTDQHGAAVGARVPGGEV
jgi:lactoylglutathione lyase